MQVEKDVAGCKALIASILNQAVKDAIGYRFPRNPYILGKDVKQSEAERNSWRARQYISANNRAFCIYVELLGIDPVYFEQKFLKEIRNYDFRRKSVFNKKLLTS